MGAAVAMLAVGATIVVAFLDITRGLDQRAAFARVDQAPNLEPGTSPADPALPALTHQASGLAPEGASDPAKPSRPGRAVTLVRAPLAGRVQTRRPAEAIGVTRRSFLNRSILLFAGLTLSGFASSVIAFLWPTPQGGFGSILQLGTTTDLLSEIAQQDNFLYNAQGRLWLTPYPTTDLDKARKAYSQPVLNSMEAGITVVYQVCPHLGCRVPGCLTSQWFECPCHGSQYNRVGEKQGGPAPRGMDRFATNVEAGILSVDTGTIIQGPPIGTNTTGQEAEGPHCVGGH